MPDTVDPKTTAFAPFLNDPRFPSDGTIPTRRKSFSRASDSRGTSARTGKSRGARQRRPLLCPPEHAEPGRFGHDQRHQQKSDFPFVRRAPTCRCGRTCCRRARLPPGIVPALHRHPRLRSRLSQPAHHQRQRRITSAKLAPSMAAYVDFTVRQGQGSDALPELQRARHRRRADPTGRRAIPRPISAAIRSSRSSATCS